MTNMELRRKIGCKPRRRPAPAGAGRRSRRSGRTRALMDAFGIEMLAPGELDLTPECVERARAERDEAPLAE